MEIILFRAAICWWIKGQKWMIALKTTWNQFITSKCVGELMPVCTFEKQLDKIDSCQIIGFFPTLLPPIMHLIHLHLVDIFMSYIKMNKTKEYAAKKSMWQWLASVPKKISGSTAIWARVLLSEGRQPFSVHIYRHMWRQAITQATTSWFPHTLRLAASQCFAV